MLNRRLLRAKVFQGLYAMLYAAKGTHAETLAKIQHIYQPDPMAVETEPEEAMKQSASLVKEAFERAYESNFTGQEEGDLAPSENINLHAAIVFYKKEYEAERKRQLRLLIADCQQIELLYIQTLRMLVEMSNQVTQEDEECQNRLLNPAPLTERQKRLINNPIMEGMVVWEELQKRIGLLEPTYDLDEAWVRKLYRDHVKSDPIYIEALEEEVFDKSEALTLLRHLSKSILQKYALSSDYFERMSMHWADNATVIRNMVIRTLKTLAESGHPQFVILSTDWEDDEGFITRLFQETYAHWDSYTDLVAELVRKWDVERLAQTDMILIKMALTEMLYIESVPIKVTLNEYVELAKIYGTENASLFINGVLDAAAERLKKEGRIRKSGKGLLEG
jgi:transcription antitermination protein NusB